MHHFTNRSEAGKVLADQLQNLSSEHVAVLALSKGAILTAKEIAKKLHSALYIFAVDDSGNGSGNLSMTALMSGGAFSYNTGFSLGELEEDLAAARFFADQQHINEYLRLNHITGRQGTIPRELLNRHHIILVSDGLSNALSLQIASQYLAPIQTKKIILATPVASAEAIDKMHILVDQIFCLSSVENYVGADHYYGDNQIPDDKTVVETIQNIVFAWPEQDQDLAANK